MSIYVLTVESLFEIITHVHRRNKFLFHSHISMITYEMCVPAGFCPAPQDAGSASTPPPPLPFHTDPCAVPGLLARQPLTAVLCQDTLLKRACALLKFWISWGRSSRRICTYVEGHCVSSNWKYPVGAWLSAGPSTQSGIVGLLDTIHRSGVQFYFLSPGHS